MSQQKLALMKEIRKQGFRRPDWRHREPLPVVSIEQFFDGNEDAYSIAANLELHPTLADFRSALERIRARSDVDDVLIEIYDIDEAETSEAAWPYSERVYVITSASESEAASWNKELNAGGPVQGWAFGSPPIGVPQGYQVWQIVWD